MSSSRLLQWASAWKDQRAARVGLPLALAATAVSSWCLVAQSTTTLDDKQQSPPSAADEPLSYQINTNFIDRLAAKAYLHFSSSQETIQKTRPAGVPETLRILTVDLPEVRRGFSHGHCSVDASRIFPDGIASPEIVEVQKGRGRVNVPVEQKAWIKSMVRCIADGSPDKVSVEILEADVGRMNPSNIRRIHQYGTLRYDPGKYTVTSPRKDHRRSKDDSNVRSRKTLRDSEETRVENEIQAPWHQQAWREEAMLRISGQVGFGETMEEADNWTKRVYGYQFKSTVTAPRSWLDVLFFWKPRKQPEGIDGSPVPNAASNRPHVVIANGLALQLVPNSLRVLQKLCADFDVPLFVIRDPRSWGGNTHPDDLGEVLRDVQKTVKQRIVTTSLQHAAGTAFTRGRVVGRLETDVKWQAKDALRRSQDITDRALVAFRRRQETDWSGLDEADLEKRLAFYGLLRSVQDQDGETTHKELSETLSKIAQRYASSENTSTETNNNADANTNPSAA